MGQDSGQIRQDIEQTRERMGDTVEALGHKTDVTGRAKEAISGKAAYQQTTFVQHGRPYAGAVNFLHYVPARGRWQYPAMSAAVYTLSLVSRAVTGSTTLRRHRSLLSSAPITRSS